MCLCTETWIKPDDSTTHIALCPPGYKILSVPRDDRVGAEVALVHREEIPVTHNAMYNYESMVCSDFKVSLSSFNLNLAAIYWPPNKSVLAFTKDILDYMEKNINASGKTLITGDFNIKINNSSSNDTEFLMELFDSFGLVNHIQFATHEHENTLDLRIPLERKTFVKNPLGADSSLTTIWCCMMCSPPNCQNLQRKPDIESTKQSTLAVSVETW